MNTKPRLHLLSIGQTKVILKAQTYLSTRNLHCWHFKVVHKLLNPLSSTTVCFRSRCVRVWQAAKKLKS